MAAGATMAHPTENHKLNTRAATTPVHARILMLLTDKPWDEFRHYYRQGPALVREGHQLLYVACRPVEAAPPDFPLTAITPEQRRKARHTGGLNLLGMIRRLRPDLVQLTSLEQLPLGLALKLLTGIKVIYDCREDNASAMLRHRDRFWPGMNYFMYLMTRLLEWSACKTFDGAITSDPAISRILGAMPASRKMIFFNTPPLSQFTREYPPLRERTYDVVLMGSMTSRSGVMVLIHALAHMKRRGRTLRTLLLGKPDPYIEAEMKQAIAEAGLAPDLTITGWVDHHLIPRWLAQARLGVVTLRDLPKFRNNIACKAFEYMAIGLPVISSDLPPERLFLKENHNALFFKPGDHVELADRIEQLLDDPERAQRLGDQGRADVEREWNCEQAQADLCAFYAGLIAAPLRRLGHA